MRKRERVYTKFKRLGIVMRRYRGFIYNGNRQDGKYISKAKRKQFIDAKIASLKEPSGVCIDISTITSIF